MYCLSIDQLLYSIESNTFAASCVCMSGDDRADYSIRVHNANRASACVRYTTNMAYFFIILIGTLRAH